MRGGEVLGEFQTLVEPRRADPALHRRAHRHHRPDGRRGAADRGGAAGLPGVRPRRRPRRPQRPVRRRVPAGGLRPARGCPGPSRRCSTPPGWPGTWSTRDEARNRKLAHPGRALFRSPVTPDHRALTDARATVDVLHALIERVGNLGVQSLEELSTFTSRVPPHDPPQAAPGRADLPHAPGVYLFRDERGRAALRRARRSTSARGSAATSPPPSSAPGWPRWSRSRPRSRPVVCATPLEAARARAAADRRARARRTTGAPGSPSGRPGSSSPSSRSRGCRSSAQVRPDGAAYIGPFGACGQAELAVAALHETFPLRQCTGRLPRVPPPGARACLLADLGPLRRAVRRAAGRERLRRVAAAARAAMTRDAREVVAAMLARAGALGAAQRFEEAAVARDRLLAFLRGAARAQRLGPLAATPELVAARRTRRRRLGARAGPARPARRHRGQPARRRPAPRRRGAAGHRRARGRAAGPADARRPPGGDRADPALARAARRPARRPGRRVDAARSTGRHAAAPG